MLRLPAQVSAAGDPVTPDSSFLRCFNEYWREFRTLMGPPDTVVTFRRWKTTGMATPFRHKFQNRTYVFYSGFKNKTHYFGSYFQEVAGFTYFDNFMLRFREHCEKYKLSKTYGAITLVQSLGYVQDTNVQLFTWEPCGEKVTNHTFLGDIPKYPIETLVENGGDCEDLSILMAAMLEKLGYDVVLINPPGHLMVGISGDFSGKHVMWNGKKYYYIESTAPGWKIGELPPQLDTDDVRVIPLHF